MRRALTALAVLVVAGGAAGWLLSAPDPLPEDELAALQGDPERGRVTFAAAGCASCHTAPDAEPSDAPVLSGGRRLESDFGTFVVPNISPSPQGIGEWSQAQVMNAVLRGVDDEGEHLYPAFPWTSYRHADPQDVADLVAYLRTLPPSDAESQDHELAFPFNVRRGVGLWKRLFLEDGWVLADAPTPEVERGRYLAESLGHCGECHTPRTAVGALDTSRWLAGAPDPAGDGRIPNITPGALDWTEEQIAEMLKSGFLPDYDVVGGSMAEVVRNTAQLTDEDRLAIAAYLKAVPAVGE